MSLMNFAEQGSMELATQSQHLKEIGIATSIFLFAFIMCLFVHWRQRGGFKQVKSDLIIMK